MAHMALQDFFMSYSSLQKAFPPSALVKTNLADLSATWVFLYSLKQTAKYYRLVICGLHQIVDAFARFQLVHSVSQAAHAFVQVI